MELDNVGNGDLYIYRRAGSYLRQKPNSHECQFKRSGSQTVRQPFIPSEGTVPAPKRHTMIGSAHMNKFSQCGHQERCPHWHARQINTVVDVGLTLVDKRKPDPSSL